MSTTQDVKARCLCGHYQLCLAIPKHQLPLTASVCHCDSCRHALGSLYVCVAYVPEACLKTVQDSLPRLKATQWSSRRTAYFCPNCGSTIIDMIDGRVTIHTGSLDQFDDTVQTKRQIYVKDTRDGGFSHWLKDLPIKTHATVDDSLPKNWLQTSKQPSDNGIGRLHAHCLCSGVSFWISRPLTSSANPDNPKSDVLQHNSDRGDYDVNNPWWLDFKEDSAGRAATLVNNVEGALQKWGQEAYI